VSLLRRGETNCDDHDVLSAGISKPARTHVDAEVRRRAATVCKAHLPPATPGAISTLCRNEPVNELGYCAEHLPK